MRFCGYVAKRSNPNLKKFYTKWIATPHAVRFTATARNENNFEIVSQKSNINLVKTFLTSITFDSLSRKIKSPCLVIKILSKSRNSMKNSKKLFLIVLSVLALAFISCKDKGTDPTTFKPTQLVGTWNDTDGQGLSFTFSDAGEIDFGSKATITEWDANKDKEVNEWTVAIIVINPFTGSGNVSMTFKFTSASECQVSGEGATVNFKKS